MTAKIMTAKEKEPALREALQEALVLAEIMEALSNTPRDSDEVPCTWVGWLGECIFRVAQKIEGATA
ncbi:hypothetical protein [Acidisoma cladoniae]|uniref:hypothetical protein n=1 Tax=Acidisoma cladoniae TaxID=3040935 RepID=UPI00254A039D|nr:hypothetical protein [Acidisoma sp. PAMC 29798]